MLRSRDRHTTYRGLAIIVRWVELDRGDAWGPGTHRFTASFLVAAQGAAFGRREHLHRNVFDSYHAAAAFALAEAKRSIDTVLELEVGGGLPARPRTRRSSTRQNPGAGPRGLTGGIPESNPPVLAQLDSARNNAAQ